MATSGAKRLYFLRHGLADRSAWSGSDFERPLTAEGKQRLTQGARTLARLNLGVDLILTSPLIRARQTADIVASTLNLTRCLQVEERLAFGCAGQGLVKILQDHPAAHRPLLVGHEPDFSLTISEITGGSRVICKKGSLARVDLTGGSPLRGELVWLLPPKVLAL
jgi:phosphohistidine phosphatase